MGIGGVFVAGTTNSDTDRLAGLLAALPLVGVGILLLAMALRSRIVIDGLRIEVRNAFRERTADLSQIEGFRTVTSRNGSYTQLWLKDGRGKISFSNFFDADDDYRAWFQQIIDLDKQDREALLDEISRDTELGTTPEERLSALSSARRKNVAGIVLVVAAAAGLNFFGETLLLPSAVVLALSPLAVLLLVQRSPLLYVLFGKKVDPRADLGFIAIVAGIGLLFHTFEFEFPSMTPLLLPVVLVALVYLAAFFNSSRKSFSSPGTVIGLLFAAILYGYGLIVFVNTGLDNAKPTVYAVEVNGKHETSGKSTTYYLELAPWGPLREPNEISISSSVYGEFQRGDQICLGLHPGRLHTAWYRIVACPIQPNATPDH